MERIRIKQRELVRCEARMRKEKQFNRKVAINAELREIKIVLSELEK
jgi:chaperonin cofactor prefoldin